MMIGRACYQGMHDGACEPASPAIGSSAACVASIGSALLCAGTMCAVVLKAKLVSVGLSLPGGAASKQDSIQAWAADQVAEVRAALARTNSWLIIMVHGAQLTADGHEWQHTRHTHSQTDDSNDVRS